MSQGKRCFKCFYMGWKGCMSKKGCNFYPNWASGNKVHNIYKKEKK
jgi:hypothetical protein